MTVTAARDWLDEAIEELEEEFPGMADYQLVTPTYARTEVTDRILKYVTDEFNEGKAGNRRSLPSTHDVAKACTRGSGQKACRRAQKHLNRLMWSGEIIQVRDKDMSPRAWSYTYWALPNSGLCVGDTPVAVTVSAVNRYGFTDEEWAAMKPYQRNLIRELEMAEVAPSSWKGGEP